MSILATPEFIARLPKAELHLHIEGSLEPEMLLALAARNQVDIPFADVDAIRQAYAFTDLQSFLDIYYQGMAVLQTIDDFYDLTWAYIERCKLDNVVHCEIFCDPQAHTDRGIPLVVVLEGIHQALADAQKKYGITSRLIPNFLRHLGGDAALQSLLTLQPYLHLIDGVGLDSSELGFPPHLFTEAFAKARAWGLKTVAHAGEEGPPEYMVEALDLLKVSRIDHGVRVTDSEVLAARIKTLQMPLTVCPLSNVRLCVYAHMRQHPILKLLDQGLMVTVNSDDPAYFGGYMNANFNALSEALGMTESQALALAKNSFTASFLTAAEKSPWLEQLTQIGNQPGRGLGETP